MECLRQMHPGTRAEDAKDTKASGFGTKCLTPGWFSYYKHSRNGSRKPLSSILTEEPSAGISAEEVAGNMGWLTWADVFKVVLRAVLADLSYLSASSAAPRASPAA